VPDWPGLRRKTRFPYLFGVLVMIAAFVTRSPHVSAAQDDESLRSLLMRIEQTVLAGDPDAYGRLVADSADRPRAATFAANQIHGPATRAVLTERGRQALAGVFPKGYRLIVDAFVEFGAEARVSTWQLDVGQVDGR
jgi:hypothetical protein